MFRTAIIAMMAATLIQHLGLSEAVAGVAGKIAKCGKCMSFWVTLLVLLITGAGVFESVMLSVLMAYLSYWFGIILVLFNRLYDEIWRRMTK